MGMTLLILLTVSFLLSCALINGYKEEKREERYIRFLADRQPYPNPIAKNRAYIKQQNKLKKKK